MPWVDEYRAELEIKGIIVDLFAGGGGASTGIYMATGRHPDIAVDYSPSAIAMHEANHPSTRHVCASVWDVPPREVCNGMEVGLLWASPDCTHFSRARGNKPREAERRELSNVVIDWAASVRPSVIILENVWEFTEWGKLLPDGRPCPDNKGKSFELWVAELNWLGYYVEWRLLVAADYGVPTTRKRLFLVARCDGVPISWPAKTHGVGCQHPWRSAAEVIDWSLPVPSIFGRARPLAEKTLARIARGIKRFIDGAIEPFVVEYYGSATTRSVSVPLGTVTTHHRFGLAAPYLTRTTGAGSAYLCRHFGGPRGAFGRSLSEPVPTVTAVDHHALVAAPFTHDRRDEVTQLLGYVPQVTVGGVDYTIGDIGMRMLTPRELFDAQGFPPDYDLLDGKLSKTEQVRLAGNSVCPPVAAAIVRAQFSSRGNS